MPSNPHVTHLLDLKVESEQEAFLKELSVDLNQAQLYQFASDLRQTSLQFLRTEIDRTLRISAWLKYLSTLTTDPHYRALGFWSEGHARSIGLGEYQDSILCYDEAAAIFDQLEAPLLKARIQINKVWPLSALNQHEEALQSGVWASNILEEYKEFRSLAGLLTNLSIVHSRLGQDRKALDLLERAQQLYIQVGGEGEPNLAIVAENRAISLRRLGNLKASISANDQALQLMVKAGFTVEVARVHQSQARNYLLLGRYTKTLALLDNARELFHGDDRHRDVMLLELYISDCLLQLRRFGEVLQKCRAIRLEFEKLGAIFEGGQAILNEAIAYAGLGKFEAAFQSLTEARDIFTKVGNHVWVAHTYLETAALLQQQGDHAASIDNAQAAATTYHRRGLRIKEAYSQLFIAHAAIAMEDYVLAQELISAALTVSEAHNIASLTFQARYLQGKLATSLQQLDQGMTAYNLAISELEQLRGQLIIEFRAEFLSDKERVYEDIVHLCLEQQLVEEALTYVERAKSRALLDLITYRVDLGIRARTIEDLPMVERLLKLRKQRDRLYHRWRSEDELVQRGGLWAYDERHQVQEDVVTIEQEITETWHRLLIRNVDYAQDAAMWQVRTEPIRPYLNPGSVVLEFFTVHSELVLFVVTPNAVRVCRLPGARAEVDQLLPLLSLNWHSVKKSGVGQRLYLLQHARTILSKLYDALLSSVRSLITNQKHLIIVPHGPLHYLPFHALIDGNAYLVERYEISYLPSCSLLRYYQQTETAVSGMVAVGHSFGGQLPYTVQEASQIASLGQGKLLVESEATLGNLHKHVANCRYLHLAAHGEFRADNALFSGIALADGWLTTLDVFNMRLAATLVTLSACQTGRNVISGGDELLGLMRAFLAAGAASLIVTQWAVDDQSTAQLMTRFYQQLLAGRRKGAALRAVQRHMLQDSAGDYAHPYFWAPFYLVGESQDT